MYSETDTYQPESIMAAMLKQLFNDTAVQAHMAFPEALERLVVLMPFSDDKPVFVAPQIQDQLPQDEEVHRDLGRIAGFMDQRKYRAMASEFNFAGTRVDLIALSENLSSQTNLGWTSEMQALWVLDHEIGHHVVPNGQSPKRQLAESAADAFAMLRHIQRFGMQTGFIDKRACAVVLAEDAEHYTCDAIAAARAIAQGRDVASMSLQQTATLAGQIAEEQALDMIELAKVSAAFHAARDRFEEVLGKNYVAKFFSDDQKAHTLFVREAQAVLKEQGANPHIARAAQRFLSYIAQTQTAPAPKKAGFSWKLR